MRILICPSRNSTFTRFKLVEIPIESVLEEIPTGVSTNVTFNPAGFLFLL